LLLNFNTGVVYRSVPKNPPLCHRIIVFFRGVKVLRAQSTPKPGDENGNGHDIFRDFLVFMICGIVVDSFAGSDRWNY